MVLPLGELLDGECPDEDLELVPSDITRTGVWMQVRLAFLCCLGQVVVIESLDDGRRDLSLA